MKDENHSKYINYSLNINAMDVYLNPMTQPSKVCLFSLPPPSLPTSFLPSLSPHLSLVLVFLHQIAFELSCVNNTNAIINPWNVQ